MKYKFFLVLIILTLCGFIYASDTSAYVNYISSLKKTRDLIRNKYLQTGSQKIRDSLINEAQTFLLLQFCDSLFPYWYGTAWDFYGQTRTPGRGKIACGYFVTTVLEDAGFNVPRIKWAKSASEYYIKILSNQIQRFSNQPIQKVTDYINSQSDGLYIVGLDCHVGFIFKMKSEIKFVHSNYYHPSIGVMEESLESQNPLRDSKYRVIGRILDQKMVKSWILNVSY